jgi:hypothetical protein
MLEHEGVCSDGCCRYLEIAPLNLPQLEQRLAILLHRLKGHAAVGLEGGVREADRQPVLNRQPR